MKVVRTDFQGLLVIEPKVYEDHRGFFLETFNRQRYLEAGVDLDFVQDNHSKSCEGTIRGLHYQLPNPQGKLIWAIDGVIFDVAVDMRSGSSTFGRSFTILLSSTNRLQVYIPPGFAHGFCVISEVAEIVYKCTSFHRPEFEHVLRWNDPELLIDWPVKEPKLSQRDCIGLAFKDAPQFSSIM